MSCFSSCDAPVVMGLKLFVKIILAKQLEEDLKTQMKMDGYTAVQITNWKCKFKRTSRRY